MRFLNYSVVFLLLFTGYSELFAEKSNMKYGKISEEEINLDVCPIDSNASAVILGDYGTSRFEITQDEITLKFERHIRIKIFDKEAFNKGNFKIYLGKSSNGDEEKVTSIKGAVYNMVNGKLVKSKLERSNIFKDELSKYRDIVKVTMPDIKEGSILELEYKTDSPFLYNLNSWYFQDDIPTLKSVYNVYNIEWYYYKNWVDGYIPVDKQSERRSEKFQFLVSAEVNASGRKSGGIQEIAADVDHWTYTANNVPAFKNEPFITTASDYLASVHFELQSTKYPWAPVKNYSNTWKDINSLLNKHEDFGVTIKNDGYLKDIAVKISTSTNESVQKTILAYDYIKNQIAWNGSYSIYVEASIRKAFNEHVGNSADINLNLVALCKSLNLEAYPVLVSTRRHGKVRQGQAVLSQFNHTIAAVKLDGKVILMDASDRNCPFGLLPAQCLNGKGRLINSTIGEWVDLYSSKPYSQVCMVNMSLDEDNELLGTLSYRVSDYAAVRFREDYRKEESEEDFIIEFENDLDGIEISEFKVDNLDSINLPVTVTANIKIKDAANMAGDMIYIKPKVINRMSQNIFKEENRIYPVDFNFPIKKQVIVNIKFPEGYAVEEVPEPVVIGLPDKKGKYMFVTKAMGNSFRLTNQFEIKQTIFSGLEYPEIKQFYEMIVTKEAEQLVAKKVN